jgi:hypothetical protein
VFSESNVVDNSSLPPLKGTVFVSTRHVAFESALIKKRKIFSHAELRSVAKGGASQILRQDNAIVLHALLEGAEAELKWEFGACSGQPCVALCLASERSVSRPARAQAASSAASSPRRRRATPSSITSSFGAPCIV